MRFTSINNVTWKKRVYIKKFYDKKKKISKGAVLQLSVYIANLYLRRSLSEKHF